MKKHKTFFDEDIVINEKLFDNFKLDNIASWSHLELWCAIQNVEVNYDFFKGILCGTAVIKKLFSIVLDAIEHTNFLDEFINNEETIEIIEKLYASSYLSRTFKGKEFWLNIACKYDQINYFNYWNTGLTSDKNRKYKLLDAIFKKNPFVAVKFYDKCKMAIHSKDIDFERWLLKSFHEIGNSSPLHLKVFNALNAEVKKQTQLAMYLN